MASRATMSANVTATNEMEQLPPVRCLFLDNYDSYSYNLIHLIAVLTGCGPVVRFSTTSWEEITSIVKEQQIDCIVISPGPGNPERAGDFGVCERVYRDPSLMSIPILGICLGLQGQCATGGSHIIPAVEPRHGRLSALAHDNRGLFAHLPQGLKVVRYNSLVADVASLPSYLHVSAWAEWDDPNCKTQREIMGIRQTDFSTSTSTPSSSTAPTSSPIPLRESVQFHPESICTQHGRQMMWNWFHMVVERKRQIELQLNQKVHWHQRDVLTSVEAQITAATLKSSSSFTLLWRKLPFFVNSEQAFLKLYASCSSSSTDSSASAHSSFWLDSSKVELGRSRFSYMGDNLGPLSYSLWYDLHDRHQVYLRTHSGQLKQETEQLTRSEDIWRLLEQKIEQRSCDLFNIDADSTETTTTAHATTSTSSPLPFNFECGFVGYIGYAMKQTCTPDSLPPIHLEFQPHVPSPSATTDSATSMPSSSFRVPDLGFMFADRLVVFDHQENEIYLLCLCDSNQENASLTKGREWIQTTTETLRTLDPSSPKNTVSTTTASLSSTSPLSTDTLHPSVSIQSSWFQSEEQYLDAINSCLTAIREGESYEICLTNQLTIRVQVETDASQPTTVTSSIRPLDYYRTLRHVNPAAYAAFFQMAYEDFSTPSSQSSQPTNANSRHWSICCSSPERFLQVNREHIVESKPIKGTSVRGQTPEEDAVLKQRLQDSTKDFAENLMIVDLLRNDLGRVCEWGSVQVTKLMEVETYATVHNLVSTIQGHLRSDRTTFDLIQAAFPPGSMTGAPKLRTCQILAQLECEPNYPTEPTTTSPSSPATSSSASSRTRERGIYSGSIGWIGLNGGMSDLNVVIRTAILRETTIESSTPTTTTTTSTLLDHPHTVAYSTEFTIGAGGAIVYLSDPHEEYAEILLKTKALVHAIQVAAQGLRLQLQPRRGDRPTENP